MEALSLSALYPLFLECTTVTTDTRNCPEGALFVALKGDKFNGNLFAERALEMGAKYAVVDEPECIRAKNDRILRVENSLETLQQLAHYHRKTLGTKILGITGTNGKTTTKELIASVLSAKYNLLYTQGNLNNQIGVPLTLLRLRPEHELAVVEMGASHPGDIKELAEIADPDFGMITNVGHAHLEGFGSFEAIIRTKGELYDHLRKKQATVFVNASNTYLVKMLEGLRPVYYSGVAAWDDSAEGMIQGRITGYSPFLSFDWKKPGEVEVYPVDTRLIGDYNLDNALAAVTVGVYFEVSSGDICRALREYVPSNNRSQLKETKYNRLIMDAYNANPTSMMAALRNFFQMEIPHKAVILGDMKELGSISPEEHRTVLQYVVSCGFERAVFVGSEFKAAYREGELVPGPANENTGMEFYDRVEDLIESFRTHGIFQGYTILIKGSNSIRLSLLTEEL